MPQRDGCHWGSPSGGCWSSGMWWRHFSRPSATNRRRGNSLTPVTGKKTCCGKYAPELSVCMSSSLTSFCQCLTQPMPYCSQRSPWFTDRNASWPPCSVISWCSLSNHLPCASRSWLMSTYQSPLILRQERTLLWGKRQIGGSKTPVCQRRLSLSSTRTFCCSTRQPQHTSPQSFRWTLQCWNMPRWPTFPSRTTLPWNRSSISARDFLVWSLKVQTWTVCSGNSVSTKSRTFHRTLWTWTELIISGMKSARWLMPQGTWSSATSQPSWRTFLASATAMPAVSGSSAWQERTRQTSVQLWATNAWSLCSSWSRLVENVIRCLFLWTWWGSASLPQRMRCQNLTIVTLVIDESFCLWLLEMLWLLMYLNDPCHLHGSFKYCCYEHCALLIMVWCLPLERLSEHIKVI